jgi:formin 2/WAS/WASL-interacting protein
MGFMDKAKKMAEQAQAKLEEAQKQFNEGQSQSGSSGPAVEYDNHGRPIPQTPEQAAAPPHGDPVAGAGAAPAESTVPPPTPGVPPTGHGDPLAGAVEATPAAPPAPEAPAVPPTTEAPPAPPAVPPTTEAPPAPAAPPAQPTGDAPAEDRNNPSYAPPKLSSGDPLAG